MRKHYTKEGLRNAIYGHWNPDTHQSIWLENGVYRQLQQDLEYYRTHTSRANPDKLLKLLNRMMENWNSEREEVQRAMRDMVAHYNEVIDRLNDETEEVRRLQKVIQRLQQEMNQAIEQQNQLNSQIQQMQNQRANALHTANDLRNTLVEQANALFADIYFQKYAEETILQIRQKVSDLYQLDLEPGAIQSIALDGISDLQSAQREVNKKKTAFSLSYLIATEQIESLREQIDKWEHHTYFDLAKEHKIDVDFWSRGQFSELKTYFADLSQRIEGSETRLGYMLEDLKQDIERLNEVRQRGEEIFEEIMNVSNMSEQLEAMGNMTAYILSEDFNYILRTFGFNNDDERDMYVVQMENPMIGSKIQFSYVPLSQTQSLCDYKISFARYQDEEHVEYIVNSILGMLKENGISFTVSDAKKSNNIVPDIAFVPQGQKIQISEQVH